MAINPLSPNAQQTPPVQKPQNVLTTKKNDGDGDEVNGADPVNEKAKEAAKASNQLGSTFSTSNPTNPTVGKNVNKNA